MGRVLVLQVIVYCSHAFDSTKLCSFAKAPLVHELYIGHQGLETHQIQDVFLQVDSCSNANNVCDGSNNTDLMCD